MSKQKPYASSVCASIAVLRNEQDITSARNFSPKCLFPNLRDDKLEVFFSMRFNPESTG